MTTTQIDRHGLATRAAGEAQFALLGGDTTQAAEKYAEAARVFEREAAATRTATDRSLLRFLAASNYYHGGHYANALRLARRVEGRYLPERVRRLFAPFVRDVRERADAGYPARTRGVLLAAYTSGDFNALLELLKQHPFLYRPSPLAFLRAVACDRLQKYEAATRFYRKALAYAPDAPDLYIASVGQLFRLHAATMVVEVEQCLEWRLKLIPHLTTQAVAAVLRFTRAEVETAQPHALQLVIDHALSAFEQFQAAPAGVAGDRDIRELVLLALSLAQGAARNQGRPELVQEFGDHAVTVAPYSSRAWISRGIGRWDGPAPSADALADFRRAVELGADSHTPYTLLAQDAMTRQDAVAAQPLIESALLRQPGRPIQAALYSWLAICADILGNTNHDPDALFRRARELDPGNPVIAANYQEYQRHTGTWQLGDALTTDAIRRSPSAGDLSRRFDDLRSRVDRAETRTQSLLAAA